MANWNLHCKGILAGTLSVCSITKKTLPFLSKAESLITNCLIIFIEYNNDQGLVFQLPINANPRFKLYQGVYFSTRGGEWYLEKRGSRKILAGSRNHESVFDKFLHSLFLPFLNHRLETFTCLPKILHVVLEGHESSPSSLDPQQSIGRMSCKSVYRVHVFLRTFQFQCLTHLPWCLA